MDIHMLAPVSGQDYPRTWNEFLDWFPTEEACLSYLEGLRWPKGFICPSCGGVGHTVSFQPHSIDVSPLPASSVCHCRNHLRENPNSAQSLAGSGLVSDQSKARRECLGITARARLGKLSNRLDHAAQVSPCHGSTGSRQAQGTSRSG